MAGLISLQEVSGVPSSPDSLPMLASNRAAGAHFLSTQAGEEQARGDTRLATPTTISNAARRMIPSGRGRLAIPGLAHPLGVLDELGERAVGLQPIGLVDEDERFG